MPLTGRNRPKALVIGGSTGIGRAIADSWAQAGADTTVMSRSALTGESANRLSWIPLDLSDVTVARTVLHETAKAGFDTICYSAVHYGDKRAAIGEVDESEWWRQVQVNLHGLWLTTRAFLPALRRSAPGLLVSVSSEVIHNGGPHRSGYAATKSAAASLLNSVAQEEDESAVRIVQVLPSEMVDTPGIRRRRPEDFDYGDYMRPALFGPLASELLATRGAGHHRDSLVVGPDSAWYSVREQIPVSQSQVTAT